MARLVGFHALGFHRISASVLEELAKNFLDVGIEIALSESLLKPFEKTRPFRFAFKEFSSSEDLSDFGLLLSLGGDGTLLDTLLMGVPNKIPMLGVNFGRLGFLPNAGTNNLSNLTLAWLNGQTKIISRSMLELRTEEENPFGKCNFALNEISLTKRDTASMITIQTLLNEEFLNDYWGDGLILSTPTGSTGYSLSCGGPILWPESKGIILTPVSPHNLSMRPIVLPDNAIVELKPKGRQQKIMLSMDSRSKSVTINQTFRIQTSKQSALFLEVPGDSFSKVLREKLFWGKDLRN
jgi:NAD+ kinase